tara:strand:- start:94 stop:336 length:243 start_codon:yes stop_codon:yes gene_type:complete
VDSYVRPTIEDSGLYFFDKYPLSAHLFKWRGEISITGGLDNHNLYSGPRPSQTDQTSDSRSLPARQSATPGRRTDVHVDL